MNRRKRLKICVVLVDRANYGRLKPLMRSICAAPDLDLRVLAAGTMVLERFDLPVRAVRRDGFQVHGEVYLELEGSIPATMAKSLGFGVMEFAGEFQRLKPDVVLVIGDRYEALAAVLAAAYMNICIVHIQGGEVSGSIDESARHAITKFAHFHVPSTRRSAEFLVRMGESPERVLTVGCPGSDIARSLDGSLTTEIVNASGSGAVIDVTKPFVLAVFHPVTTNYGDEGRQMDEMLRALDELSVQTILLWPNVDAGADHISKAIRVFRTTARPAWLRTVTNFSPEDYLKVLSQTACAVGNSSSFVRDASYFGTPVVLVGDRQDGRETDAHVLRSEPRQEMIVATARRQLRHGKYAPSTLYGDGCVSERIAAALVDLQPYVQKRLAYVTTGGFPVASRPPSLTSQVCAPTHEEEFLDTAVEKGNGSLTARAVPGR